MEFVPYFKFTGITNDQIPITEHTILLYCITLGGLGNLLLLTYDNWNYQSQKSPH
jgi:hypothetical protein